MNFPSPEQFALLSEEEQTAIINNFIKRIRELNIFPVFYFNQKGISKEIISVINKNDVFFDDKENLITQANQGSVLLDFLFPNIHAIKPHHSLSQYEIFYDDEKLFKCLKNSFQSRKIYNLKTAFFSQSKYIWNTGTNFLPIRAKAIYQRFCPKDGVIYDYSAGFGGRMLGALSSNNNYKYIAVEPNSDTFYNLLQLGHFIENITKRKNSFEIYQECSQNFIPKEKIDFAFSCPPFFTLQKYCDEPSQSIQKNPKYNDWLENYVRPTVKNCYQVLKDNGIFAVDLMNYANNKRKYNLIEDWLIIALQEGFYLRLVCDIVTNNRKKNDSDKEKILVFTKDENINISSIKTNPEITQKHRQLLQQVEKRRKVFCYYDIYGKLINNYPSLKELSQAIFYSEEQIQKAIITKKRCKEFYFRVFSKTDIIPQQIPIKPIICKINNTYFDSCAEVGRALKISRQAVHQAYKKKSKRIIGQEVFWY